MPKPKPHEFRIRMSPELMATIDAARGRKSKNELINEWLWGKAREWQGRDEADHLAESLRTIIASVGEEERASFIKHAIAAVEILLRSRHKKSS